MIQLELFARLKNFKSSRFDGSDYNQEIDQKRLSNQIEIIFNCITDGRWRTLGEIELETGFPQASISAQLRNLRKERFGSHEINKRRRGNESSGLWEYKLFK